MTPPQTLDRAGIARRIPHSGTMCLLDRLEAWDDVAIRCTTGSHARPDNPLRTASGLLAPNLVEYAAQAMALHGGLLALAIGQRQGLGHQRCCSTFFFLKSCCGSPSAQL